MDKYGSESPDTLPWIWIRACRNRWDRPILYQKALGIWQGLEGRFCHEQTLLTALGLKDLDYGRGDRLLIIGRNDPHWYYAQFAATALGGVFVGAYPDALPEEIDHILYRSGAILAFAEDQEQVDKLLSLERINTRLRRIIYWDERGMKSYKDPLFLSFEALASAGRRMAESRPDLFQELLNQTEKTDPCSIYLSSGTTMHPKLVLFDHQTLIHYALCIDGMSPARAEDRHFSYTPLASIGDMVINGLPALMAGSVIYFPERPDTLMEDLREVAPSRVISLPRAYESQVSEIMARINDSGWFRRKLFRVLMKAGKKRARKKIRGLPTGPLSRATHFMGELLLYRSLKDWLGFSQTKLCISSGGALSEDFFLFFHAIGLNLLNVYGTTETGTVSAHTPDDRDPETVGRVLPGCLVKISKEGEILVKGLVGFLGYVREPGFLEHKIDSEGFFHTGDAGHLDEKGHLIYLDRLNDLIALSDGTTFSPQFIENRLKFSPYIRDAVVFGRDKPYIVSLISVDFNHIQSWAEARMIAFTTYEDLIQRPTVQRLIRNEIVRINQRLPKAMAVRKMAVLPKQLDADDEELTRTSKLRRSFIGRQYQRLSEALYGDEAATEMEVRVRYPNGRMTAYQVEIPVWTTASLTKSEWAGPVVNGLETGSAV